MFNSIITLVENNPIVNEDYVDYSAISSYLLIQNADYIIEELSVNQNIEIKKVLTLGRDELILRVSYEYEEELQEIVASITYILVGLGIKGITILIEE